MAFLEITLVGEIDLQNILKEIPDKLEEKGLPSIFADVGRLVLNEARDLVPVDSGDLKNGLRKFLFRNKRVGLGVAIVTPSRRSLGITSNQSGYYPAHIELGTSKMPAQPYLRPAIRRNAKRIERELGEEAFAHMRSVARRRRRKTT